MKQKSLLQHIVFSLALSVFLLPFLKSSGAETFDSELSDLTDTVAAAIDKADLKAITVADFSDLRGEVSQLGRFLADEVSTGLVLAQKKFTVVDRANLKRIMDEQKLTTTGLVDPENAKKLGQLAGVDAIVIGTITPLANNVRVTIKVLATDSAKLVGAARSDLSKTGSIQQLMDPATASIDTTTKGEGDKVAPAASETPAGRKPVILGSKLKATIDSVKVLNDASLEIYVTYENESNGDVAVYLGDLHYGSNQAQHLLAFASDNTGIKYLCESIGGVTRVEETEAGPYRMYQGGNQYVIAPSKGNAQVRYAFRPTGLGTERPRSINFTSELRVVTDSKTKRLYDRTLNVLNCKVD